MSTHDTPDRAGLRLHPASVAFELLVQLRQFLPVLLGGGVLASSVERWTRHFVLFAALMGIALAVSAVIRALTTRYWIEPGEIVVRQGLLFRRVRHMPFERVQNVLLQQGLVHRPFRLYTVRLETGAGNQADADLRVLSQAAARQIEAAVRRRGDVQTQDVPPDTAVLQLGLGDVLLAGLVLDRGFLIVAAGLAGLFQLDLPNFDPGRLLRTAVTTAISWTGGLHAGSLAVVILGFLLLVKLLTVILSMGQALLQWYRFRLEQDGPRLRVDSGLLTRARASATPDRVQIVSVYDGLWLRLLRRRAIGVSVSGASTAFNAEPGLDWLAPIAHERDTARLVATALPRLDLARLQWTALHPATAGRLSRRSLLLHGLLAVVVGWFWWKLLPLVVLLAVLGQLHAWSWTRYAGYAFDGQHLAWRSGVTSRISWIVPISRLAAIRIASSPFDRRHRSVHLILDTQAPQRAHALRLQYLPEAAARELAAVLRKRIEDANAAAQSQPAADAINDQITVP